MLLTESRFSVLRGLSAAEYGEVRGMIIDTVLYTDLSKHFDFTAKLKSIAAQHGHSAWSKTQSLLNTPATSRKQSLHSNSSSANSSFRDGTASCKSSLSSSLRSDSVRSRTASIHSSTRSRAQSIKSSSSERARSVRSRSVRSGSMFVTDVGTGFMKGSGNRASVQPDDTADGDPNNTERELQTRMRRDPSAANVRFSSTRTSRVSFSGRSMGSERRSSAEISRRRGSAERQGRISEGSEGNSCSRSDMPRWRTPFLDPDKVSLADLMITAIKYADLGHVLKPIEVHKAITQRVTNEFWALGDLEKSRGVPVSPLCDRVKDASPAKSQVGFLKFVCMPFYEMLGEIAAPSFPPILMLHDNMQHWVDESAREHALESSHRVSRTGGS
mmetsp:Transcript_3927/g.11636  ORF Transcript_3927/g.11636 Transcript_3927/m.11636 type:complete len:386 (+) Transcript_3927:325-1482(+)